MKNSISSAPIVVLCLTGACAGDPIDSHGDPAAPSASGTIEVNSDVDLTEWTSLEIHFRPMTADDWQAPVRQSEDVASITFPYDYVAGTGIGYSQSVEWKLSVWLTENAEPGATPVNGEPFFETILNYADCDSSDGYGCGVKYGVNLELASP